MPGGLLVRYRVGYGIVTAAMFPYSIRSILGSWIRNCLVQQAVKRGSSATALKVTVEAPKQLLMVELLMSEWTIPDYYCVAQALY